MLTYQELTFRCDDLQRQDHARQATKARSQDFVSRYYLRERFFENISVEPAFKPHDTLALMRVLLGLLQCKQAPLLRR
jgi:hypothetical protein